MPINVACPRCNEQALHRSRSRNAFEQLVKKIFPYRLYRCHQCQWRGWISQRRVTGKTTFLKLSLFYIGIMILSFIIACLLWIIIH